jgi:hypothetical protein
MVPSIAAMKSSALPTSLMATWAGPLALGSATAVVVLVI